MWLSPEGQETGAAALECSRQRKSGLLFRGDTFSSKRFVFLRAVTLSEMKTCPRTAISPLQRREAAIALGGKLKLGPILKRISDMVCFP